VAPRVKSIGGTIKEKEEGNEATPIAPITPDIHGERLLILDETGGY